jgi:diguanylate cyclase (GGDEF)-like protein/PAS domain S-box-containing protein
LVYEWDLLSDAMCWRGEAADVFGAAAESLFVTGEAFHGRINPEDLPKRLKSLSDHYLNREVFDCEYRVRRPDGEFCWVHDRGRAVFASNGEPVRFQGVLRPVDRRKQHEARLEHLANFDELTGHFNRNRLRQSLQQLIVHGQRYGIPGAYLSIGIDKLSLINDAYGYITADAVIVAVGQRLERIMRASDVMGRMGGDVFGVVLSHCPEAEMRTVAEKVLRVFRDYPIHTPSGPMHVTVSIGGVAFPTHVQTSLDAITRADAAMHEAKRQGRDCFSLYRMTDDQRRSHRRSMAVCEQVKDALKEDRLVFAYQPVMSRATGAPDFYECLIRLRQQDGSVIAAAHFVPVVERLGLVRMLDRRVLELAVRELTEHPNVRLALNISGLTPADHGWLRALMAMVGQRRDIASRLIIEITETAAIQDIDETARFVGTVRGMGCQVALDDFGAGYTSFRHLKTLTVDIVKIDGSYIMNIAGNEDNRLFVRTLVDLAKNFGLRTVAECVETEADVAVLDAMGVDCLQGYYFAKPKLERPWRKSDATRLPLRPTDETSAVPLPEAAPGDLALRRVPA